VTSLSPVPSDILERLFSSTVWCQLPVLSPTWRAGSLNLPCIQDGPFYPGSTHSPLSPSITGTISDLLKENLFLDKIRVGGEVYIEPLSFVVLFLKSVRTVVYLSHPLLKITTWRYWFRLSGDVYDGNRSFASYTKTNTVKSDVWCLLTRLVDGEQSTGSKYLNTVQGQNSSFSFKQWIIK
jgi:hypothetical protein